MSKVSVLIPYYNHEKYIVKALDSILEDSYHDKQIVLINDGSPCNGDKVIKEWIEKNGSKIDIKYRYRENKGLNRTLNELISMADGECLVLMGSDDFLLDGGIEKRVQFLEENPDLKAVFADSTLVDMDDNIVYESALFGFRGYPKDAFKDRESIKKTLLKRFVLAGPILMVKKDIYDVIGLYDESLLAEDLDFYLRVLPRDLVGFVDEKVCAYRVHDTNQSIGETPPRLLRDARRAFVKNLYLYPLKEQPILFWNIFKFFIREQILKLQQA